MSWAPSLLFSEKVDDRSKKLTRQFPPVRRSMNYDPRDNNDSENDKDQVEIIQDEVAIA